MSLDAALQALASQIEDRMGSEPAAPKVGMSYWENRGIFSGANTGKPIRGWLMPTGATLSEFGMADSGVPYHTVDVCLFFAALADNKATRDYHYAIVDTSKPTSLLRALIHDRTLGGALDGQLRIDDEGVERQDEMHIETDRQGNAIEWHEYTVTVYLPIAMS